MKHFLLVVILSFFFSACAKAEDISSCLTYTISKIKPKNSELILNNIITDRLYNNLSEEFPAKDISWKSLWKTEHKVFVDDTGAEKTSLEACFKINDFQKETQFISEVMDIASLHFKKAFEFYFKNMNSNDMKVPITEFGELLQKPEIQKDLTKLKNSGEKKI